MGRITARIASVDALVTLAREGEDNRHWYREGRALVDAIADSLGHAPRDVAVVMAATSPVTSVTNNITLTLRCLALLEPFTLSEDGGGLGTVPMLRSNAEAIRRYARPPVPPGGVAPLTWEARVRYALGPKTGPFARALMGDADALVLDTWMLRAVSRGHRGGYGVKPVSWALPDTDPATTSRIAGWFKEGSANRAEAERRIRAVATALGWSVAEAQAAIWAGVMRRYGRKTGIALAETARRAGIVPDL